MHRAIYVSTAHWPKESTIGTLYVLRARGCFTLWAGTPCPLLESIFYLPLNVMDLGQLFIRFMATDDAWFMDHIFIFQMFMYNRIPHSLWLRLGYMFIHLLKHCCFSHPPPPPRYKLFSTADCMPEFTLAKVIEMFLAFWIYLNALHDISYIFNWLGKKRNCKPRNMRIFFLVLMIVTILIV